MKKLGVLLPVASLPGKYGVGSFGEECFDFIKFLSENDLKIWQILPLNETGRTNCPYSSLNTFSFDIVYLDVKDLVARGLISQKDLIQLKKHKKDKKIDYVSIKKEKKRLLDKAFDSLSDEELNKILALASKDERLKLYGYFCALLRVFNIDDWRLLDEEYQNFLSAKANEFALQHQDEINKTIFCQMLLKEQWDKVLKFAKNHNVQIWGDVPIYSPAKSFDVFRAPQYYKLNKDFSQDIFGGVPGDQANPRGQNWGTCIYNWNAIKKENYKFLVDRFVELAKFYDVLRLDHFIGLVEHYEIDRDNPSRNKWVKAGGAELFEALKQKENLSKFVIEDLGPLTSECVQVKNDFKLKGMRIMQYAFNGDAQNIHLPENVDKNSVYYLGNHDNDTFVGFLNSSAKREAVVKTFGLKTSASIKQIATCCLQKLISSKSENVIFQMQDLLLQDGLQRTNIPGVAFGCWEYRCPQNYKGKVKKILNKIKNHQ